MDEVICLGIDPGWSSCGVSLNIDGVVQFVKNYVPKDYGTPFDFIQKALFPDLKQKVRIATIEDLYIERYVAYAGVHSSASEEILMNIGAISYAFKEECYMCEVHTVRAIDWKQRLCKYLVRTKQFSNPYPSFDKRFSVLAAQTISGNKVIDTNHEADAICLSFLKEVEDYERNHRKSKT